MILKCLVIQSFKYLFIILILFISIGCKSTLMLRQDVQLEIGMNVAEVILSLGKPSKIELDSNKKVFIYYLNHKNPNPMENDLLEIKDYFKLSEIERKRYRSLNDPRSLLNSFKYEVVIVDGIVTKINAFGLDDKSIRYHDLFSNQY